MPKSDNDWESVISRYESSGLGVIEFCERENIPKSGFYNSRKRLGKITKRRKKYKSKDVSQSGFIELSSAASLGTPLSGAQIELELPHGIVLRVN